MTFLVIVVTLNLARVSLKLLAFLDPDGVNTISQSFGSVTLALTLALALVASMAQARVFFGQAT